MPRRVPGKLEPHGDAGSFRLNAPRQFGPRKPTLNALVERVDDAEGAALGLEDRLEHHCPLEVAPVHPMLNGRGDVEEAPLRRIEDRSKERWGVHLRHGQPVDTAVRADEGGTVPISQEAVVTDGCILAAARSGMRDRHGAEIPRKAPKYPSICRNLSSSVSGRWPPVKTET